MPGRMRVGRCEGARDGVLWSETKREKGQKAALENVCQAQVRISPGRGSRRAGIPGVRSSAGASLSHFQDRIQVGTRCRTSQVDIHMPLTSASPSSSQGFSAVQESPTQRFTCTIVLVFLFALGMAVLWMETRCSSRSESGSPPSDARSITAKKTRAMQNGLPVELMLHTWWPLEREGVKRPPTVPAADARLGDDEEVLGVELNGVARAYRLAALRDINRHIVNDVVHGVPLSVMYCDFNDCARAYKGPAGPDPLPIRMAGMKFGDLIFKVGDVFYQHTTAQALEGTGTPGAADPHLPPLPFAPTAVTRTTWRVWKQQHPRSDVYVGVAGRVSQPTLPPANSPVDPKKRPTEGGTAR